MRTSVPLYVCVVFAEAFVHRRNLRSFSLAMNGWSCRRFGLCDDGWPPGEDISPSRVADRAGEGWRAAAARPHDSWREGRCV